jgi:hypothetical protein
MGDRTSTQVGLIWAILTSLSACGAPIAETPLAGVVDGVPFAGKMALAKVFYERDGTRSLSATIFAQDASCAEEEVLLRTSPYVAVFVPDFRDGQPYVLPPTDHAIIFDDPTNIESTAQGPEDYEAFAYSAQVTATLGGTAAELGVLRLRAQADDRDQAEGQVPVAVCP